MRYKLFVSAVGDVLRASAPVVVLLVACAVPTAAHQPHDPVGRLAASPAFASDATLFVATKKTTQVPGARLLLRSTDGGASWSASHRGLPNHFVQALAVSPGYATDRTVLAGTCRGLFVSRDGGAAWGPAEGLAGEPCIFDIAIPASGGGRTVYMIARDEGVLVSADGGRTWSARPAPVGGAPGVLALLPSGEKTTLVVGGGDGVHLSPDGGRSWSRAGGPLAREPVTALAVDRMGEGGPWLWAAGLAGIWRSGDGGATWQAMARVTPSPLRELIRAPTRSGSAPGLPASLPSLVGPVTGLLMVPGPDGGAVLATTVEGVWRRSGATGRWTRAETGTREPDVLARKVPRFEGALLVDGAGGPSVLLSGWDGLHRSEDGGATWRHVEMIRPYSARGVAISPGVAEDGTLVVSTYGTGVHRSTDAGRSWHDFNRGMAFYYLDPVAFSPPSGGTSSVFVGGLRGLGFQPAAGDMWNLARPSASGRCPGPPAKSALKTPNDYVRSIAFSPDYARDGVVWVGAEGGCIFRSGDRGRSWRPVRSLGRLVMDLKAVRGPDGATWWLAGLKEGGVVVSTDGGTSFRPLGDLGARLTVSSLAPSPGFRRDGTIFAGTFESGVMVSRDHGATWSKAGAVPVVVLAVAVSPAFAEDRTLFAATNGAGVLGSSDAGATWSATGFGEPLASDLAVSASFATDGLVLVGSLSGAHLSRDRGRTFEPALDRVRYRVFSADVQLGGAWGEQVNMQWGGMRAMWSEEPGATLDFWFVGRGIAWIGDRGPRGGRVSVRLDGGAERVIDLRGEAARESIRVFESGDLGPGPHHLQLRVLPGADGKPPGRVVAESLEVRLR